MHIKDIFLALQENLALSQFPGRVFKFGIPPVPVSYDGDDNLAPGLYLDWFRGRYLWKAGMCGASQLQNGEVDFNALIAMQEDDVPDSYMPSLKRNQALAIFMCELGEELVSSVIATNTIIRATNPSFFAAPMTLTHSFVKDEPVSLVNLLIRCTQLTGYGEA